MKSLIRTLCSSYLQLSDTQQTALSTTAATQAPEPRFIAADDILPPENLSSLGPDKYVFLVHHPAKGCAKAIQQKGLRSRRDLRFNPHPREARDRSNNDPTVIYFRPKHEHSKIFTDDVFIAVRRDAVFVFDQENRSSERSLDQYRASAMTIDEYQKTLSEMPPGCFVDQDKGYSSFDRPRKPSEYLAECCVKADRIPRDLFVPHHYLPIAMQAETYHEAKEPVPQSQNNLAPMAIPDADAASQALEEAREYYERQLHERAALIAKLALVS